MPQAFSQGKDLGFYKERIRGIESRIKVAQGDLDLLIAEKNQGPGSVHMTDVQMKIMELQVVLISLRGELQDWEKKLKQEHPREWSDRTLKAKKSSNRKEIKGHLGPSDNRPKSLGSTSPMNWQPNPLTHSSTDALNQNLDELTLKVLEKFPGSAHSPFKEGLEGEPLQRQAASLSQDQSQARPTMKVKDPSREKSPSDEVNPQKYLQDKAQMEIEE